VTKEDQILQELKQINQRLDHIEGWCANVSTFIVDTRKKISKGVKWAARFLD
jgi:hypothetical protein